MRIYNVSPQEKHTGHSLTHGDHIIKTPGQGASIGQHLPEATV